MILRKLVILVIVTQLLVSCAMGYKKEDNRVFYKYWNAGMGIATRTFEIENADFKTFEKLEIDCNCSFDFARDQNHLYIDGYAYNNVDPKSFRFIGNYTFEDKDSIYFFGFYNNFHDSSIKGIEKNRFTLIEYPWSKAGNVLIHGKDTLKLDDTKDFKPIDRNWGKTNRYIIYKSKILPEADVNTFEVTDTYSGKDKNYFYEFGEIKKSR